MTVAEQFGRYEMLGDGLIPRIAAAAHPVQARLSPLWSGYARADASDRNRLRKE